MTEIKRKGRGFQTSTHQLSSEIMDMDTFEALGDRSHSSFQKCTFFLIILLNKMKSIAVEGWILCITGVHEEAQEDALLDRLSEYGNVQNIHMNLDRRTGFVKGYALAEYKTLEEAQAAKEGINGSTLYDRELACDFAFIRHPLKSQ